MSWWSDASRGAAYEFGARHYRAFSVFHALRWARRPIGWTLAVLALAAGAVATWRYVPSSSVTLDASRWRPALISAAVVIGVIVIAHFAWDRYTYNYESRRAYTGRTYSLVTTLGLLAVVLFGGSAFVAR
jgi:hypothetical protein